MAGLRWVLVLVLLAVQVRSAVSADVWQAATAGPRAPIGQQFFGQHVHQLAGLDAGPRVRQSPWWGDERTGMRLWDAGVSWLDVNRSPGTFDFSRMDAYIALAQGRGIRTIYPLGMTPAWASKRPAERCPYGQGCAAEPRSLDDWKAYVRAVLARYPGKLWMVEVWNEPYFSDFKEDRGQDGAFFTGDAATLVAMTRIVREAIDELSPSTLLCSPSFVGSTRRLDLFLEKGGGRYLDALCSHLYADNTRDLARHVLDLRAALTRGGLSRLAILNTESGVAVDAPPKGSVLFGEAATRDAAARMAQQLIVAAMAGVDAFYYYAWDNGRTGFFEPDGGARPGLLAWIAVKTWLIGVQPKGCQESALYRGVVLCRGERAGLQQAWIWHDGPGTKKVLLSVLRRELGLKRAPQSVQPLFHDDMDAFAAGVLAGEVPIGASPITLTYQN